MKAETKKRLMDLLPERVQLDVPLAGMTSFGLGGPAEVLVRPETADELVGILDFIRVHELPFFVLGGGSNVLVRDDGYAGVVIHLGPSFSRIKVLDETPDRILVEAGAAAPTASLLKEARRNGWAGLEFMAGVPGSLGGALAMNAGSRDQWIAQSLHSISIINGWGRVHELPRHEIKTEYRRLILPKGAVIVQAVFKFKPVSPEQVETAVRKILERRAASQPKGVRSAGSVFRNPPEDSAGRLIEQAGLKGRTRGGARVATEHANFIVHDGRATASDVLGLMKTVQTEVREHFGVLLEPEIIVLGRDQGDEA